MWTYLTLALLSAAPVEYRLDPRPPGFGDALSPQDEPAVTLAPAPFVVWTDFRVPLLSPDLFVLNALDGGLARLVTRANPQHSPQLAGQPDGGLVLVFEEDESLGNQRITVMLLDGSGNPAQVQRTGVAPSLAQGPQGDVFLAFVERGTPSVYRVADLFADGGALYRDLAFDVAVSPVRKTALSVTGPARVLALETRDSATSLTPAVKLFAAFDGGWALDDVALPGNSGSGLESPRVLATEGGVVWCAAWEASNQRTQLLRAAPGQAPATNTTPLREVSVLDVGSEIRVIGVGAQSKIESASAEATLMGVAGNPTVHFQRPQTQPRQDQLVVAQSAGQYLFAWTWGATVRNVSAVRVTVSQPNPPLLATSRENQEDVRVASVGDKTLAVWRTGHKTLRAAWVGEPLANTFQLTTSVDVLTDFSVASNDSFVVVAWREGNVLQWVRFPPGGPGTPQASVPLGAGRVRVVSDGRVFWLTGLSDTTVFAYSLGDGTVPGGVRAEENLSDPRLFRDWASSCVDGVCVVAWVRGPVGETDLRWFSFPSRQGGQVGSVSGPIAASTDGTNLQLFWHDARVLSTGVLLNGALQGTTVVRSALPALRALEVSPRPPLLVALGLDDRVWSFALTTPGDLREDLGVLSPSIVSTANGAALGYHRYALATDSTQAFALLSTNEPDAGLDAGVIGDGGLDAGAGSDGGVDAGTSAPDAGPPQDYSASGCSGCSSLGAGWAALAVVWALRRRKANA